MPAAGLHGFPCIFDFLPNLSSAIHAFTNTMPKRKQQSEQGTTHPKRVTTSIGQPSSHVQSATNDTTATRTKATGLAFRISCIPSRITGDQLLQILEGLPYSSSLGGDLIGAGQHNVLGWSFAPSAASADSERYRTATVTFKSAPSEFQFPGTSNCIDLIPNSPSVIVDKHFYGLTPLNSPEQPTVE